MGNNGNRTTHYSAHVRPDVIEIPFRFTGAGAAAIVDKDAGQYGTEIASIARTSIGLYAIVPNRKYNGEIVGLEFSGHVGPTPNLNFKLSSINMATPAFSLLVTRPGAAKTPAWATIAVAGHTSGALPAAGYVAAVELAAGGVVGGGHLTSAAPAVTREVQVAYAAGVATLNFLAGDAVTSAKYLLIETGEQATDLEATDSLYMVLKIRTKTRN